MNDKTEKEVYKVYPLKKICMTIGELPTSYLETMSYYEMLIWFINYLRDNIIPTVNNNAEAVQELQNLYEELRTYVNNYFDNKDWQEMVNNKLNKMVEDGTLESIIGNYISIIGINVKSFGALGDGLTDDTEAIQDTIDYAKANNYSKIIFPKGDYKITDSLTIDFSNVILEGIDDATISYYGDGTVLNLFDISGINANDYIENITLKNLKIDGTNQTYKGGYSMETPTVTSPNPVYRGIRVVYANYVKNLTIENCNVNDFYGDGFVIRYSNIVNIKNNKLFNVGGGNIVSGGQTGYDNFGDGIVCFYSYNCNVSDNTLINKRTYQENRGGVTASGKLCGRSGLEFEYLPNNDTESDNYNDPTKNCPDYQNIPVNTSSIAQTNKREGSALRFFNNFVQGYTKGIHVEAQVKTIITNNSIVGNYINVLYTTNAEQILSDNYLNTYGVGNAPQGGYDGYSGNIAVTQYTSDFKSLGMTIVNNSINGDTKGITIGRNCVNIENNNFTSKYPIYAIVPNLSELLINGNTFKNYNENDDFTIFLYSTNDVNITNNLFINDNIQHIDVHGKYINISNNIFNNMTLAGVSYPNATINGNIFKITKSIPNTQKTIIYGDAWEKLTLINNKFDISSVNDSCCLFINGSINNYVIENNEIHFSNTQTKTPLFYFGTFKKSVVRNNLFKGTADNIVSMQFYQFNDSIIENNENENTQNKLANIGASFGVCHASKNIGSITYGEMNGVLTNFVNSYIQKGEIIQYYGSNSSNTFFGWYCQREGFYITDSWTTGTSYNANKMIINSSNKVYKCITKGSGTSTVEPTHTTVANVTETDGYEWEYLGDVALLSQLNI